MADKQERELVVIGGGPGGYAAAFLAADKGMKVTLVDPEENPGGVCLYRGCIPSKALLHLAKVVHEAAELEKSGIKYGGGSRNCLATWMWSTPTEPRHGP